MSPALERYLSLTKQTHVDTLNKMFEPLRKQLQEDCGDDDAKKFDIFIGEKIIPLSLKIAEEETAHVFTDEELTIMADYHEQNPWIASKTLDNMNVCQKRMQEEMQPLIAELMQQLEEEPTQETGIILA